jgi:hypothetical protein
MWHPAFLPKLLTKMKWHSAHLPKLLTKVKFDTLLPYQNEMWHPALLPKWNVTQCSLTKMKCDTVLPYQNEMWHHAPLPKLLTKVKCDTMLPYQNYLRKWNVIPCSLTISRKADSYSVVVCERQTSGRPSGDDQPSCCRESAGSVTRNQGTAEHYLQVSGQQYQTYATCREDSAAGAIPWVAYYYIQGVHNSVA